jgi:hypothetical protein
MIRGMRWLPAALLLVKQAGQYCREHERLFGKHCTGRPPKPSADMLKELDCTFQGWIEKHDLRAMIPLFTYTQAAQGYGTLETVPALYGLWWNTPLFVSRALHVDPFTLLAARLLLPMLRTTLVRDLSCPSVDYICQVIWTAFQTLFKHMQAFGFVKQQPPCQTVLRCGYQKLWESMAGDLDVCYNCPVTFVDRSKTRALVKYQNAGMLCKMEADLVVVSLQPMSCVCMQPQHCLHATLATWSGHDL